jgi:hypothetical protein
MEKIGGFGKFWGYFSGGGEKMPLAARKKIPPAKGKNIPQKKENPLLKKVFPFKNRQNRFKLFYLLG